MGRLLALWLALASLAAAEQKSDSLFHEIDGISRDLEEISGLPFKHKVPSAVLDKEQLRKFLSQRIDKVMKPADIKAESITLKMLGLIPSDFDLRQETVDLLTEQAAAFYDYQKKQLFLMHGDTGEAALMALSHELSHALADQNFHLERYVKQNTESDDAATARMAVMEGQASWLMSAYLHKRAGLGSDVPQAVLEMMSGSMDQGAGQYPVYAQAPLFIRESLVFPYKAGMLFQDAVYRKLGKQGFAEVFQRPPVSTQQVMHPEFYLDRRAPSKPVVPQPPDPKLYRKLAEGTLGEFDYKVLIEQYGSGKYPSLAAALRGSQFALLEQKKQGYPVLAWVSQWESPERAAEFFAFYRDALQAKAKSAKPGAGRTDALLGSNEWGFYQVTLAGDRVESLEGLKFPLN